MTTLARNLRRGMTPAERLLWKHLRARRFAEVKFNQQVPIGQFIADFCSFEGKVVVEVDGGQHDTSQQADEEHTRFFQTEDFTVLRFWNNEVLTNVEKVMLEIEKTLNSRSQPERNNPSSPP